MTVRRTLPHKDRRMIGAWCFVDHYGPDDVRATGGMNVPAHPHAGIQTVSWLMQGQIEHRDSAGNRLTIGPGELNLMTAGRGISHSERSTPATDQLHGVQLWVALPDEARFADRLLDHYVPDEVGGEGWRAKVFVGSLFGSTSPVPMHSTMVGAELLLVPQTRLAISTDSAFEHGVLVDTGTAVVAGQTVQAGHLAYVAPGRSTLDITSGADSARIIVLGGIPFDEPIVMWWNFVARTHDEIVAMREAWQSQLVGIAGGAFGLPPDEPDLPLPAPALPHVRLKPRPAHR